MRVRESKEPLSPPLTLILFNYVVKFGSLKCQVCSIINVRRGSRLSSYFTNETIHYTLVKRERVEVEVE